MKKLLYFLIGILGFAVIFSVSALVTFNSFPENENAQTATQNGAFSQSSESAPVNGNTAENEMLTIVRPALDKSETKVSYGTITDVISSQPPAQAASETPSDTDDDGAQPDSAQPNTTQSSSSRPSGTQSSGTQSNNTQSSGSHSNGTQSNTTQSNTAQSNTTQSNSSQSSGTQSGSSQQQQTQQPQTSQEPQTPQEPQQPQKPSLNPDIKTSDTGL